MRQLLDRLTDASLHRPLLVLATYRDDECPDLPKEIPTAEPIKLKRFDKQSVTLMAQAMLGPAANRQAVIERLQEETEGNAFFIVEVLRALAQEAGQLTEVGAHGLPANVLSGGVRAVLEHRLQRVPTWARALLDAAAVFGRQLDPRVLGKIATLDSQSSPTVETWLTACADLSILEVSDQRWRFSHDKLREVLLEQIKLRGDLSSLHRSVAVAMEQTYAEAERSGHAASLAFHFGQAGDSERAARYSLQAGAQSLHDGALEDAVARLQATLHHQESVSVPLLQGVHARRLLATALIGLGRMEECAQVVVRLHDYVGHTLRPRNGGRANILLRALSVLTARNFFPKVRVTPELPPDVVRELEHNFVHNAAAFAFTGQPTDILLATLQHYILSTQVGLHDSRPIYDATAAFLISLLPLGLLHRRGPKRPTDDLHALPDALYFERMVLSAVNNGQGHWAQTRDVCDRGIALTKATGDIHGQAMLEVSLIYSAIFTGRHQEARGRATELVHRATKSRNTLFVNHGVRFLATLDLIDEKPHAALERLHKMYTDALHTGDALGVLDGLGLLSRASLLANRPVEARAWAEQALDITRKSPLAGFGGLEGYLAPPEVLTVLASKEQDAVQQQILTRLAGQALLPMLYYVATFPIGQPRAWLVFGLYARLRGKRWLARHFFQRAADVARELAMPHEVERAQAAQDSLASDAN